MTPTGYLHADYTASLSEWGRPRLLERSGGWLLERDLPSGAAGCDAMGPYPLFCCRDWNALSADLASAGDRWVAVSLVADPLAEAGGDGWRTAFDRVVPFRDHFVVETGSPHWMQGVHARHRKHALRALDGMRVRRVDDPPGWLDAWDRLHAVLAERHGITGMRRFSRSAFARQLAVPGLVMFAAERGDDLLGLDLWYVQDGVAQGHLAAFSPLGYELRASYATKWTLLGHFAAEGVRWVNLGGAAAPGLRDFKAGWTPHTRPAWLCTRILEPARYAELAQQSGHAGSSYFPAYRTGEFG